MSTLPTAGFAPGRLRLFPGDLPALELWLTEPRLYRLGRHAECDLCLDDSGISRIHLLIDCSKEPWLAEDPGSKNGSRIDGRPLSRARLGRHCWFSLAGVPGRFERLTAGDLEQRDRLTQQHEQTASLLLDRLKLEANGDQRLDALLQGFLDLSGCQRGALLLGDDEGDDNTHLRNVRLQGWDRFEGSETLVRRTIRQGRATASNDLAIMPSLCRQASMVERSIRSVVCLPLRVDNEVRGALYGESQQPGKLFTELDVDLMQALADQAMLLLGAESLRKAIRLLSQEI